MQRKLLSISGADAKGFLEGLVSNAVSKTADAPVYAALLSPQGKYLFDFIMSANGDAILLDVAANQADTLAARLNMYRLRADVVIKESDLQVVQGVGPLPDGGFADPRSDDLGWRKYCRRDETAGMTPMPPEVWNALRVEHCVPETGVELIANDSYILEAEFERLNGVDFKKGCYVGQEVTARMKHKTELKKGLAKVSVQGTAPPCGTAITSNGKDAGVLYSAANGQAIAYLRFDRATGDMTSGDATIRRI